MRRGASPARDWLQVLLALANGPARLGPDCILWPHAKFPRGYGAVKGGQSGGTTKATHAVLIGTGRPRPSPPGDHALHSCDTPACVHPDHLRWGTHAENMADRKAAGRY